MRSSTITTAVESDGPHQQHLTRRAFGVQNSTHRSQPPLLCLQKRMLLYIVVVALVAEHALLPAMGLGTHTHSASRSTSTSTSRSTSKSPTRSISLSTSKSNSGPTASKSVFASRTTSISMTASVSNTLTSVTQPPLRTASLSTSPTLSHSSSYSHSTSTSLSTTHTSTHEPKSWSISHSISATVSPTATFTPSNTTSFTNVTPTPTAISTPTLSDSASPSTSLSPSTTRSQSPTASASPSTSSSPSTSQSPSWSQSPSLTFSRSPTSSASPTTTSSASPTTSLSPSSSATPSGTSSPSVSATATPTNSSSPTTSSSLSPSVSRSPSTSASPSTSSSLSPSMSGSPTTSVSPSTTHSLSPSSSHSPTSSASPTTTTSPTGSVSPSLSTSASPSVSGTPTTSDSSSPSESRSPTVSVSPTTTSSMSPSSSASPTTTGTWSTTTSLSPSSSRSPTISASPSMTPSASPSESQSPSVSVSPSPSPSPSPSGSVSPTVSASPSISPTTSVSPTVSASPSVSPSPSVTTSPTRSTTVSESATLSPVWPERLSVTVAQVHPFYTVNGVPVFNFTGNQSLTIYPRLSNGADMVAGFYRHPQPPFAITLEPAAVVVATAFQCTLSLPCTVEVDPTYDWWVPALLSVQYDNTFGPYEMDVALVYKQGPTIGLEVFVEDPVVEEMSPMPEIFVRGVDSDGHLTTFDKHVNVTVTIDDRYVATTDAVLTGKYTPPIQECRAIRIPSPPATTAGLLLAGQNHTFVVNATTTLPETVTNLTWGAMNLTVVKCPPPAIPVLDLRVGGEGAAVATFSMPFTLLRHWVSVECLFGFINTTVTANLTKAKCFASCVVPWNATSVSLYVDGVVTASRFTNLALPSGLTPTLYFYNNHTANRTIRTWNSRLGCVSAFLLDPNSQLGLSPRRFRMNVSSALATITATDGNITTVDTSTDFIIREDVYGWSVCELYLPGSGTWHFYNATVVLNLTVVGEYSNGTKFYVTALAEVFHQPDVVCRNRDASILTPVSSIADDRRNITVSRNLSAVPWRAEAVFVDNSSTYYNPTAVTVFYVVLNKSIPSLAATVGRPFASLLMLLRTDGYMDLETLERSSVAAPYVASLEGCPGDVFPNALMCHARGTTPITITGQNFDATHYMSFYFSDNPRLVPCQDTRYLSPTVVVCSRYPGFGNNGSVVFHDEREEVIYSVSRGFMTYAPNAAARCPFGANGQLCSGRGYCQGLTGTCACDQSIYKGFWGGEDCGQCSVSHNASDSCVLPCPVDAAGAICGNRGYCEQGRCWCGFAWAYSACNADCPGGGGPCSGHGFCDNTQGTCDCVAGFGGANCSVCAEGYSGATCNVSCPRNADTNAVCSDQGTCHDGACYCASDRCGSACELLLSGGTCGACSLPGLYGASCASLCPGASVTTPCSGHGTCSNGIYGTGVCKCVEGYALADCSTPCPHLGALPCGGHGTCDAYTAKCQCERYYGGPACTQQCPYFKGLPCSGHGACDEGWSGSGLCFCYTGYSGQTCNLTCANDVNPCSGHGTCVTNGTCVCNRDTVVGFWDTATYCSSCLEPWNGPECNGRCPSTNASVACSGHGTCNVALQCTCVADRSLGFWGGLDCSTCLLGYYGPTCTLECPGGACDTCGGHGLCSGGIAGNGLCTCFNNATTGFWTGTQCSSCKAGYYGISCTNQCPTSQGGLSCPNGVCNDGTTGTGGCRCNLGFALNSIGLCLECAAGYYGTSCLPCPSTTEQACSGQGLCDDGYTGNGLCACNLPYAGANCSYTCAVALGKTCGRGACVAQDFCICEAGFELINSVCTTCKTGLWGPDCAQTCPACSFGSCTRNGTCLCNAGYFGTLCDRQCPGGADNPCNRHGVCNATTGACTCFRNLTSGYYIGVACATCDPAYESDACTVPCPTFNGIVCYQRGTCYNGVCIKCGPLSNETSTVLVRCGSACQLTDYQCASQICTYGLYGPTCTALCPGATSASNTAGTCSGNGICTAAGACSCIAGFYGPTCSTSCPTSGGAYCGNRGRCVEGACECDHGYYGPVCQSICPGGLSNICSRHGICQGTSGVCNCDDGYYGVTCEYECLGGPATPCFLNGLCTTTGTCQCFYSVAQGYYGGVSCETCAEQFSGPKCLTPCPASRGVVVNRTCLCRNGFVGDDCSKMCPQDDLNTPCAGRGTCSEVNGRATCLCDAGFYGEMCDVECTAVQCQEQGLYRAQCTTGTGSCQCLNTNRGRWTGKLCDTCQDGYWGTECTLPCACSNHGTCNQLTGDCVCYSSASEGYWAGTLCATCRAGYIGEACTFINVQLPSLSKQVDANPNPSAPIVRLNSLFDPLTSLLWLQDPLNTNTLRVMRSYSNGTLATLIAYTIVGAPRWMQIFNTTAIRVRLVGGTTLYFSRTVDAADTTMATAVALQRRHAKQLSVPGGVAAGVTIAFRDDLCDVYVIDLAFGDALLYCEESDTTYALQDTSVVLSSVKWLGLSVDESLLVVVGSAKADGNWAWATYNATTLALVAKSTNTATLARGTPVTCLPRNSSVFICILRDPIRLILLATVFNASTSFEGLEKYVIIGNAALEVQVTAIMRADAFDVVLIAINPVLTSGATSTVYMFVLSTGDVVSTIEMDDGAMVTAGQIDTTNRLALLAVSSDFAISFVSYGLFGIKSISPSVIDENGGAVVTVLGTGFVTDSASVVLCNVSGSLIAATVLSTSQLQCVSEKVIVARSSSCDIDYVNIIFVNVSARTTSNTLVGIYRPASATLTSAITAAGNVGFGGFNTAISVSIFGFGFVSTPNAACRFVRLSDNFVFFVTPVIEMVNSSVVVCVQQPTTPSAEPTGFQYSHDGAFYSVASYAPYIVVGPTSELNATVGSTIIIAGAVATVPAVTVYLTDEYGNRRLSLETTAYAIRCTSLDPIVQIAGNEEAVTFADDAVTNDDTANGVVVFANVRIVKPTAGPLQFIYFSPEDISLQVAITFTVVAGVAASLQVARSSSWRAGVYSNIRLVPNPVVRVADAAGNVISSQESFARVIYTYTFDRGDGSVDIGSTTQFAATGEDGSYTFSSISIKTVFDTDAFMVFSVGDVPELRVFVEQEKCVSGSEYAEVGKTTCAPCPDNSQCDGTTNVVVDPGFWRPALDAFEFYACTPDEACVGGTGCASGYTGTMCAACVDGYGRNQGSCVPCLAAALNWILVVIVLIVFVAIVYYLSIGSMTVTCLRDAEIARIENVEHNPLSVVVKVAVSYLQMLTLIPFTRLTMPSWMVSFMQGSASGSKFNPNLSFVGCILATSQVEILTVVLVLIPIAAVACIFISAVSAFWKTYKGLDIGQVLAELNLVAAPRGAATSTALRQDLARSMAHTREHYYAIVKTHGQLFGTDAVEDLSDEERKAIEKLKLKMDVRERVINMFLVSVLVALFFLYPTIIEQCASLISCRTLDMGLSKPSKSVLISDPSVDCNSATYKSASLAAWGALVGFGIGIPLLNYCFIQMVRASTCNGDLELAKTIFFFTTGGYSKQLWYWEGISLLRKMLLVLALTVPQDDVMKLLAGLWVLIISVLVNISFQPWSERILSLTETTTLAAIAATYGLLELTFFDTVKASESYLLMVFLAVAVVNIAAIGSLVIAVMWSTRKTLQHLAGKRGAVGHFFASLQRTFDEVPSNIARMHESVKTTHDTMNLKYPREYSVALAELAVAQMIVEQEEKVGNKADVLNPFKSKNEGGMGWGSARPGSRIRLPPASSFMNAVDALASLPKLFNRTTSRQQSMRTSKASSKASSRSSDGGGGSSSNPPAHNPLTPPTGFNHPMEPKDHSAFGPRVAFSDTTTPHTETPVFAMEDSMSAAREQDRAVVFKGQKKQTTPAAVASWIDVSNPAIADREELVADIIVDVEQALAVLKRAEGYTAMRLRAILNLGESEYASQLIEELFEAEEEFFRAAAELRDVTGNVSQVVVL